MHNLVYLIGRLTEDPVVKNCEDGKEYLPFNLAVQRSYKNEDGIYEADSNFKIPNDTYFNIITLEKEEIPSNSKNCCEIDKSDFTPIYNYGKVNDYYNNHEENINVNYNSSVYDLISEESLLCWQRVQLSNRMSESAEEWTKTFSIYNSGTYNNQDIEKGLLSYLYPNGC